MAEGGPSEGFASSNLDHRGARDKVSYFHMSDAIVNQQLEKTTKNSNE